MGYTRNVRLRSTDYRFNGGQSFMDALLLLVFVIGIAIATVLASFGATMAGWFAAAEAFEKPQRIELYTTETPAEIKRKADRAKAAIGFVHYTIFFIAWLGIDYFFPEFAWLVYDAVVNFLKIAAALLRDVATIWFDYLSAL